MALVKCQLINPYEGEKIPNKPHLIISKKNLSDKLKKKKPSHFSSPPPPAVTATATLSFCFLPKPHPHAHLHLCFDSPLFLVDEANLQPFHGFCESLFSSSSKLVSNFFSKIFQILLFVTQIQVFLLSLFLFSIFSVCVCFFFFFFSPESCNYVFS